MKKETIKKGNELTALINATELNLKTIEAIRENLGFKIVSSFCYNDVIIENDIIGNGILDIVEKYMCEKLIQTEKEFKELK